MINYDNLFEDVGEFVQRVNDFAGIIAALDTDFSEIAEELETNLRFDLLEGQFTQFEQFKAQVLGWIGTMQGKIRERLTHKSTIQDEIVYGSDTSFAAIIEALHVDMVASVESVLPNTVTLGAVTSELVSLTTGTVYVTKVLDGVNAPSAGYPVVRTYSGLNSELALSDDMALTCIADSETNGARDGFESFQWAGRPTSGNNYSWNAYGSGDGPVLTPIQAGGYLFNMEFQNFSTTNTPDDWTIVTGAVTTNILETTTVYRGTKSLRLLGNATIAEIKLTQAASGLVPGQQYMVGFYVQGQAGTSAGTLTIQFEGTGYTAGGTEKVTLNAAALAALTTFGWKYFWVIMPNTIPDDFVLAIKWSGTPSAHSVWINGGGMKEAVYFNGHAAMVVAGSVPFLRDDRFIYTVTNDYAGVFQTAAAKLFGIQFVSNGSPTNLDSLAT